MIVRTCQSSPRHPVYADDGPRYDLADALVALCNSDHARDLLFEAEQVTLCALVYDPEPPLGVTVRLSGHVLGSWHVGFEFEARSAYEGRGPGSHVWVTVVYAVEIEQPRPGKAVRVRSAIEAVGETRCPHLSHRDPRASHLGHCPDCGQVVGPGAGLESLPEPVAGPSRPAGSASPDPPAATSPVAPAVAAPSGGGGPSHGFTRATTPTLPACDVPGDAARPWTEDRDDNWETLTRRGER